MTQLRQPDSGCPWDLTQDFASIVKHTIEEAYEVADVIERQALDQLPNELGDLLFQVVFYAQLAKEQQLFDFSDVVNAICEKLISRHPHVFADVQFTSEQQIKDNWENSKVVERAKLNSDGRASLLDDIPKAMPALSRANKIQKRVAHHGFDWPSWHGTLDKVREELNEVEQELVAATVDAKKVDEELGDLLFSVVNLVRSQGSDPEDVLRQANNKFERRFRGVETVLDSHGLNTNSASLEQMEDAWQRVKALEATNNEPGK